METYNPSQTSVLLLQKSLASGNCEKRNLEIALVFFSNVKYAHILPSKENIIVLVELCKEKGLKSWIKKKKIYIINFVALETTLPIK